MLILGSISGSSAHETLTISHRRETKHTPGGFEQNCIVMHLLLFKNPPKKIVTQVLIAASRGSPASTNRRAEAGKYFFNLMYLSRMNARFVLVFVCLRGSVLIELQLRN